MRSYKEVTIPSQGVVIESFEFGDKFLGTAELSCQGKYVQRTWLRNVEIILNEIELRLVNRTCKL